MNTQRVYFIKNCENDHELRHLGLAKVNLNALYDDTYKEWQRNPSNSHFEPPLNDVGKRALYFSNLLSSKCEEICGMQGPRLGVWTSTFFIVIVKMPTITTELIVGAQFFISL